VPVAGRVRDVGPANPQTHRVASKAGGGRDYSPKAISISMHSASESAGLFTGSTMFDPDEVHEEATRHGFKRRGRQNWHRKTDDFVQLINLQKSAWSNDANYLKFALWPLALGEPPTLAESKFHFRMRVDGIQTLFAVAEELKSLGDLARNRARITGMTTIALTNLLDQRSAKISN